MKAKTKRRCTYATIMLYNFCNGIEYAIIFPTIWSYIHDRYGGGQTMFGFILSAYSITSFIANPIYGYVEDKTHATKTILLIAICFEMIGTLMYFFGVATWFLACSRLVGGLGSGALASVIGDIGRATTVEERTSVISMIYSASQIGLLVGPGFNIFLSKSDFSIGAFPIDKYTSPAFLMVFLWSLVMGAVMLFFYNLTALKDEEDLEHLFNGYRRESSMPQDSYQSDVESSGERLLTSSFPNYSTLKTDEYINSNQSSSVPNLPAEAFDKYVEENSTATKDSLKTTTCTNAEDGPKNLKRFKNLPEVKIRTASECSSVTDNMIESAERFIQSASDSYRNGTAAEADQPYCGYREVQSQYSEGTGDESIPLASEEKKLPFLKKFSFFRDEFVVLIGLAFVAAFSMMSFETVITPFVSQFYGFGEMENSLIYFCAGLETILVLVSIKYISKKVSDRTLILSGLILFTTSLGLPLISLVNSRSGEKATLPYFIIIFIIQVLGETLLIVGLPSLVSKLVDKDNQALAQGCRRSMMSMGCILGPLWAGSYFSHLVILFAVPFSLACLLGVLFLCSFKRMVNATESSDDLKQVA